jgi:DNA-binding protein H-NS
MKHLMKTHTASYKELLEQRAALERQIAAVRDAEAADALQKIRALVETYGLTHEDVFPAAAPQSTKRQIAPKYRDPATGLTWTGRGKPPIWIKGQERSQFEIKQSPQ